MNTNTISKKIVITGGGTGGHVFPALTLADEFKGRGYDILYIGSTAGLENKLVPQKGYRLICLDAGGVKNQTPLRILINLSRIFLSFVRAVKILKTEKPSAVIGVGGFVSVPTALAAFVLGIPFFIQEQNTYAGIANQFLGRFARKIYLGFDRARIYFPFEKTQVTGNPLRNVFFRNISAPSEQQRTVLIMGGSQGAKVINDAIVAGFAKWKESYPEWKLYHQTGAKDFERVQKITADFETTQYRAVPFIEDVCDAYQKSSLVISRSGAMTVSELIQVKRPAVLVPYPRRGKNDQIVNAKYLENAGAGLMVEQGENFDRRLWDAIYTAINAQNLTQMREAYSKLRTPRASASIADSIESIINVQKN